MYWLSSSTIARLRDQLRTQGMRPSIIPSGPMSPTEMMDEQVRSEWAGLVEAMYIMMSSDGDVSDAETDVLRGAIRALSDDGVRSAQLNAMLAEAKERVDAHGAKKRLQDVTREIREDRAKAEVTFVLASAVAFADDAIFDQENELVTELAELLAIDEARANELLDAVEQDLAAAKAAG